MVNELNLMVAKGDLSGVLTRLKEIFEHSDRLKEIILQSSRYNKLKEKIRLGTIDLEKAEVSENKITFAILELINEVDEAIENDVSILNELQESLPNIQINQSHSGSGDNIGRNKIINL